MKTLLIVPYFGEHKYPYLQRLFASMGLGYPGTEALRAAHESVVHTPWGGVFLRNNNQDNVGFTRAINAGLRCGLANGYDLLWCGNDDLEFPNFADTLATIEAEFAAHPTTGIVGCQLVYTEEPDFVYHGGTTRAFPTGLHKWGYRSKGECMARTKERWVAGGCMIISRQCAEATGLLDEGFFNIASDSDYCYRARQAGFSVVYLPTPVMHPKGSMTQAPKPEVQEQMQKDIEHFAQKWLNNAAFSALDQGEL